MRRHPCLAAALVGALTLVAATGASAESAGSAAPPAYPARTASAAATKAAIMAASPGGQQFTVTSGTLAVHDGPSGTHAVTLAYNLYVPTGATAATPAPAVLSTNGFGLSKDAAELVSLDSFFASHGYVALAWTAQGFGSSGGCIQLDSADYDVKDAIALINLLQGMPVVARDAKGAEIGMLGGSYGGAIDENTAEADPRVRAVAASRTWNNLVYSLDPNNLIAPDGGYDHPLDLPGVFKQEWTSLFFADGALQPVGGAPPTGAMNGACAADKLASGDLATAAGLPCSGYYFAVCQVYADVSAGAITAADEATLAPTAPAGAIDKLTVPTLLTQGQSDTLFNEDDALASYDSLRARGVPAGLLWNDGGHGGYNSQPGEGEEYDGTARTPAEMDSLTIPLAQLAWMDHYLRGNTSVPVVGFSWFRDYVSDTATPTGASAYATAASYPVMPATVYSLSGADDLVGSGATAGSATVLVPPGGKPASYSETSNEQAPGEPANGVPASDPSGEAASFDTAAFPVAEESVGVPTAHLVISQANPAAPIAFFAKVFDVAPDGTATLIRRLVAPVTVPALSGPVDIHLLGFAHSFAAGHRARLTIASTDLAYEVPGIADVLTIATGPTTSTFSLPLRPLVAGSATTSAAATTAATAGKGTSVRRKAAATRHPARSRAAAASGTLAFTGLADGLPLLGLGLLAAAITVGGAAARRWHEGKPAD